MSERDRDLAAADEVLQIMYWLHGERLGAADVATIERLAGLDAAVIQRALERLVARSLVIRGGADARAEYRLTEDGIREGGRRFADEFADITKPGHGECGDPDCDCQRTGSPADCRHRATNME